MSETQAVYVTAKDESAPKANGFREWAVVEVMGHQSYHGLVSEQTIGGTSFVRVDVPATSHQPAFTKLLGSGAIYAISPMDESIVRKLAEMSGNTPISAYTIREATRPEPPAIEQRETFHDDDDEDDDDEDDDCY